MNWPVDAWSGMFVPKEGRIGSDVYQDKKSTTGNPDAGFKCDVSALPFSVSALGKRKPRSRVLVAGFRVVSLPDPRTAVADLFEFRRGRGDFVFSAAVFLIVMFLFFQFFSESGWNERDLPQRRVGKILKQPWIGPLICMALLLPSAAINLYASWRQKLKDKRLRVPDRTAYEIEQWARSFEFIAYFICYTAIIPILGYLLSTLMFAVFLTWRLGYRSRRWMIISSCTAFTVVIVFRTILQIKTPVNIWLYNQLPPNLENFMKIYF